MAWQGNSFAGGKRARPQYLTELARQLRQNPTPEEIALWGRLRDKRLAGLRFRRQHPIGRYILDFYAHLRRETILGLAVELDGAHHDPSADRERDAWLLAHRIPVLRFSNREVREDIDSVLLRIKSAALA